ncbi:MAG: DNA polymerase III subunit chi [Methylocella sp.]
MTEVLLYHLDRQPLERVLPVLIGRTLARGWRAVVQAGSAERVEAISAALWTTGEETFLPHGTARDGNADLQPVWITTASDNPNGARVRFMVDGEFASDFADLDRVIFMFDGRDEEACERAKQVWQDAKTQGHDATYWQQDETGRWQKQA